MASKQMLHPACCLACRRQQRLQALKAVTSSSAHLPLRLQLGKQPDVPVRHAGKAGCRLLHRIRLIACQGSWQQPVDFAQLHRGQWD